MPKTERKAAIPAITEEQAAFVKRETGYELGDPCPDTNMLLVQLVGVGRATLDKEDKSKETRSSAVQRRRDRIESMYVSIMTERPRMSLTRVGKKIAEQLNVEGLGPISGWTIINRDMPALRKKQNCLLPKRHTIPFKPK